MQRFANQNILVTGGTSGIGLATATRLIDEGARVLVTGHNEDRIAQTRDALPQAEVLANDVSDPASVEALSTAARSFAPDGLDAAFLNAGYGSFRSLEEVDLDHLDCHYAIDLRAPILQARALGALIKDGGKLLLIGSATVGGKRANTLVYSAMKAGIRQATRALASEFAPRRICVNIVTPGATHTRFHSRGGMGEEDQKAYKARVADMIPLGRLGEAEDVAGAACFLLSTDADYITGAELRVDGGMTML